MKKLLALVLVLGFASMAQAVFLISVDGIVDPQDTEIVLLPSQEVILDIHGQDNPGDATGFFMVVTGPGSINGSSHVLELDGTARKGYFDPGYGNPGVNDVCDYQDAELFGQTSGIGEVAAVLAAFGGQLGYPISDMSSINVGSPSGAPLNGLLVDGIVFHCEGEGEAIVELWSADLQTLYDIQVIHQIPEPLSMALLGLGGLGLLRRRR